MRFGVELPCGGVGLRVDDLVELAIRAEQAGWDGVVPYKLTDVTGWSDFSSREVQELVSAMSDHRPDESGGDTFDVAVGGRRRLSDDRQERAAIEDARRGGATWWLEFIPPEPRALMLDRVAAGALRDGRPLPGSIGGESRVWRGKHP